jgi:hypothetical protein
MHRQNVELKQVVRRLKQKLTAMEVRLYKVVEEEDASVAAPREDSSGTFGIVFALRLICRLCVLYRIYHGDDTLGGFVYGYVSRCSSR